MAYTYIVYPLQISTHGVQWSNNGIRWQYYSIMKYITVQKFGLVFWNIFEKSSVFSPNPHFFDPKIK